MNEDMPWVDLTPEEVQQLRTKKHELTEYGKQKLRELMKNKHLSNDWEWSEDAENGFVEWFNSDCGPYIWKCEYFYGDCEVEDEKTRKDLMYKWAHAAYVSGYERGLYGRMEQEK